MIPPLKVLNKNEKEEIRKKLEIQFGIKELPGMVLQRGQERIFLYQGDMNEKEIKKIESSIILERIGLCFAKEDQHGDIRLSIEGAQILAPQITKNIFEVNEEQARLWMEGSQLDIASGMKGFVIIKYKDLILGNGKASLEKISNFIPKARRLKARNIVK